LTARHREWLIANEARARMSDVVEGLFALFDVLIVPVCPVAAFPHDHRAIQLRKPKCSDGRSISYLEMINWVALATLLGLPATVVPAGIFQEWFARRRADHRSAERGCPHCFRCTGH
jgi:amidase